MPKRKTTSKKILIIVLVVAAVLVIVPFMLSYLIKHSLVNAINNSSDDYHLEIGTLQPFLLSGSVRLDDIKLVPTNNNHRYALTSLEAKTVVLNQIGFFSLIVSHKIGVGSINIDSPVVELHGIDADSVPSEKKKSVQKFIRVSEINIQNPHLKYYKSYRDSIPLIETTEGVIYLKDFLIDATTTNELFHASKMTTDLRNVKYVTGDSLYTLSISNLEVSYLDSSLMIDSLLLKPNYAHKEFFAKAGEQTDIMTIMIPKITAAHFDAKGLTEKQLIKGKLMTIEGMHLSAYRDKNIPEKVKRKLMIQQLLDSIPLQVSIDSLVMKESEVVYEEVKEGGSKAGKISFVKLNGKLAHITNLEPHDTLTVNATAMLQNKGRIHAFFSFPLFEKNTSFDCSGQLHGFSLDALNTMLRPLANVYITDGVLDTLHFTFHATEAAATGTLTMQYHDLRVALADKQSGDSMAIKEKIVSFIANNFIVNRDVPSKRNTNTSAPLYYKRNPDRFIFNYSWKTIFGGIKKLATGKE